MTQGEVLHLLCKTLGIEQTPENRARLLTQLQWRCFGSMIEKDDTMRRKFVGICRESPKRRDFVRMKTPRLRAGRIVDTCWSAQILMFLHISGFNNDGIGLPKQFRSTTQHGSDSSGDDSDGDGDGDVILALIRWLTPHPDALLRDSERRPICPPPLDINHALWTYATETRQLVNRRILSKNIMYFPGQDTEERKHNAELERRAMFDLVQPQSFEHFINCTRINTTTPTEVSLLETITIPF